MHHQTIAILDFGGQYAHLIANRVRRLGVYSEIVDSDTPASQLAQYKGLMLSGGPMSVYSPKAPAFDPALFDLPLPVLGICYGHQLMQHAMGGKVVSGTIKEYGFAELILERPEGIFENIPSPARVWMSHGDTVEKLAPGFIDIGNTADCLHSAVRHMSRPLFGVQFHVEVTHTPEGIKMIDNFLTLCNVSRDWTIDSFMEEEMRTMKEKIGDKKVFMLVSGGVDSTVAFALLEKALGKERVYGLLVDHGLMRLNEAKKVQESLRQAGFDNLHVVDRSSLFMDVLKGQTEPEKKRKIIGDLFWQAKEEAMEKLGLNPDEWIMGQGTIYPDTIETGGTKHADKIKTHHNRVDLVQEMIKAGKVIEPLAQLYKDEVRLLGEKLGLAHSLVWRQPFPGPGLGVRILCHSEKSQTDKHPKARTSPPPAYAVGPSPERRGLIRAFGEGDGIEIETFVRDAYGLADAVAQILPIKSVGVQGDERTYKHPVAFFTACRDWELLEKISTAITNRFFEVNRVILGLAGIPGEWQLQSADINTRRVELLQKMDDLVTQHMNNASSDYGIWQFPVILAPMSPEPSKESIVLRPICSTEAMTASFARIDWAVLESLAESIRTYSEISHVFYDLTHKPPGTIEWE